MLYRQRISFSIILFALLWGCSINVCQADEAIPVHTVLEKIPTFVHMDLQQNVLAFATGSKINVYDLDTGQRRWWKPCQYKGQHYDVTFGKDYAVMFREERFIALDIATGNELWQKEMGDSQHIKYGYFCADSKWLWMQCEDGQILYDMDAQKGYRIPFEEYSRWGMMPDGETLYELRTKEGKTKEGKSSRTDLEVMFWKPGELQATKQFSLESPGELIVWGVSGNAFLVSDFLYKRTPEHILRTHDAATGEIIREFDTDLAATISLTGFRRFSRNTGGFIWDDKEEPHQLHKLDIGTGNASAIAVPEGFIATPNDVTTDTAGNVWFLAWDTDYNLWLLPFDHDATPRKLLDGNRFLPSRISILRPPYLFAYHYAKDYHAIVYRLDNMQKLAEWPGDAQYLEVSRDAQYGAFIQREEKGPAQIHNTYMYSREKEEPLFKVKGSPLAVSPDGRYLAVILKEGDGYSRRTGVSQEDYEDYLQKNPGENAIHIVDVETATPVVRFDLNTTQPKVAFSEDSKYLALSCNRVLKIFDIEAEFSEKELFIPDKEWVGANFMYFSPDNKRLLTSSHGQADIFDVDTGKHISTFKETVRIIPDYEYSDRNPNFMKKVENSVLDFVGQFTDRWKNESLPQVIARFAKNGEQVITIAESRLIRVWDTETGRLIRTIDPEMPEIRNERGTIGNAVALSGNGAYALTYNTRGLDSGTLWDLEKGIKIRCYTFLGTQQMSAALSEDGTMVYALIDDDLHYLAGANNEE